MDPESWQDPRKRLLQFMLGSKDGYLDGLVVINGGPEKVETRVPSEDQREIAFELRYSTAHLTEQRIGTVFASGQEDIVEPYSVTIFRVRDTQSA